MEHDLRNFEVFKKSDLLFSRPIESFSRMSLNVLFNKEDIFIRFSLIVVILRYFTPDLTRSKRRGGINSSLFYFIYSSRFFTLKPSSLHVRNYI